MSRQNDRQPQRPTSLLDSTPSRTRAYARALLTVAPRTLTSAVGFNIAAALAALGTPRLLGQMVDVLATDSGRGTGLVERLNVQALAIGGFLLAQTLLTWRAGIAVHVLGERMLARLREDFLAGLLVLRPALVEQTGTGNLLSRATADISQVDFALRNTLATFVTNGTGMVVILLGALWVCPPLAATVLVVLPFLVPTIRWYLPRFPASFSALMGRQADMNAVVAESADGAATVQALRWEQRRVTRLEQEIARCRAALRRTIVLRGMLFPVLDLCSMLPTLTTLTLGAVLLARHQVGLGQVTTVTMLMQTFSPYMINVIQGIDSLQTGAASLDRLVAVMPTGERLQDLSGTTTPADGQLRLSGVHYAYDGSDRDVLHGIELTLHPGERLAVVGPTGAGKTTLARLMAGIDAPTAGEITLGGTLLSGLALPDLRRHVLLTTQENHVFAATVAENIRIAAPGASDAEVHRVLTAVGAGTWAQRLPNGWDTQVGGREHPLAPDRAQQLALARILLASPDILILDEATSMLAPRAAQDTEAALTTLLTGRTIVSVAHRLHTAHEADRIVVLVDGILAETGTHDDLIARDGHYAHLWAIWQGAGGPATPTPEATTVDEDQSTPWPPS